MTARNRRVRVAFWVMGVCVLAAVALASPSGLPGQDVLGTSRAALALPWGGEAIIDPGDPLISDDHVAFMDRGVYAYQDMVCGAGCGAGQVNVVHGNLVYSRQDLSIPGRGLPFEITFTYNSGSFFQGRYGYGWQLNYDLRYITNDANGNVIVVREDDRTDIFVKQPDGTFRSTYGVRDTLQEYTPDRYVLTDRQGVKYWFESADHHYVTRIEDLNGNALALSYNPSRELIAVTDASGRQLTLTYTANKLTTITDPAGRVWHYAYDGDGNLAQVTDPMGGTTQYGYTAECHDLVSVTDARGNTQTITYNSSYQVAALGTCCGSLSFSYQPAQRQTTVTDGNGHATLYRYDGRKRVAEIEDALGQVTSRTWDAAYHLTGVTDANGHSTTYTYDARSNLLTETDALGHVAVTTWHPTFNRPATVTDANGHTTTYTYDTHANLLSSVDPLGQATTYVYDSHGQVTDQTNARGYTTHWTYDGDGNVTGETDALGGVTAYSYDAIGNQLTVTDANDHTTAFGYDALSQLVVITDAMGYNIDYSYDPVGNRIGERDENGELTRYGYDELNRLEVITDALGCITEYSYDPVGNRIGEIDGNGHPTAYGYDALDRLATITDAAGYTIDYSYDPVGNVIGETDENGHTTAYGYDAVDRLAVITDALGYTIDYSYDPVGNRIGERDENGALTRYGYDKLDRPVVITDALGYTLDYSYDPVGNRSGETDENGHPTAYGYDALDRLVVITDALGYTFDYGYDPVGNRIGETDANGYTTAYGYDALDRLVVITDALGYEKVYGYDPAGNLVSATDANLHSWTYEYDAMNRRTKGTSPMSHETEATYDCAGNMVSRTDANGAVTNYGYDAVNRLILTDYPGAQDVRYAYDGVDNTVAITNGLGIADVTQRTYDAVNRPAAEEIDYGPFIKGVSYTYDGAGNLRTLTDPDGQVLSYEYDPLGRVVLVTDPSGGETSTVYDPAGRATETHFPHGVWTAYEYDDANQATGITTRNAASAIILDYDYGYDAAGQVVSVVRNGVPEAVYVYNGAGWLMEGDYRPASHDYHYTYDAAGNRQTQNCPICGETTTYGYDAEDRVVVQVLPGPNPINYGHDANANVIQTTSSWGTVTYGYDYENRLTAIAYPGGWGTIANYYSPEGEMLARDERGAWTYYYPTLLGVVVEMDDAGQTTARLNPGISMEPGGGRAEGSGDATAEAYIHWDGQGSTTYFTGDDGGQVAGFSFGYSGQMLGSTGDVDGVEGGRYVTDLKVYRDSALGEELLEAAYATDIAQYYSGPLVDLDCDHGAGIMLGDFGSLPDWDRPPSKEEREKELEERWHKLCREIIEELGGKKPEPGPVVEPNAQAAPKDKPEVPRISIADMESYAEWGGWVKPKKIVPGNCCGGCTGDGNDITIGPLPCNEKSKGAKEVCANAEAAARIAAQKWCYGRAGAECQCENWHKQYNKHTKKLTTKEVKGSEDYCEYQCDITAIGECVWRGK